MSGRIQDHKLSVFGLEEALAHVDSDSSSPFLFALVKHICEFETGLAVILA